jgi:hypothetical protein
MQQHKPWIGTIGLALSIMVSPASGLPAGAPPVPCHLIQLGSTPAEGFGAPWNVFPPGELLLKAFCTLSEITIAVGSPAASSYVWNEARVWTGAAWTVVPLSCQGRTMGSWCLGEARAILPWPVTYYAAFTCQQVERQWKCGCRDRGCAQPLWQVQHIRR